MKPLLIMSMVLFVLTGYTGFTLHSERERRQSIENEVSTLGFLAFRHAVISYVRQNPATGSRDIDSALLMTLPATEIPNGFSTAGAYTDFSRYSAHQDSNGQLYVYITSPSLYLSDGVVNTLKAPELIGTAFIDGGTTYMRSLTHQGGLGPVIVRPIPDLIPPGSLVVIGR
ncbi:type IV pilus biogenesis protein PilM [Marinobacterium sp. BA1]|uniref:type IV pilus biogenesis protein PilM n=1 Tax=Marinobacterium sp. BA1 TaxID=3138931 RepID=UPI0032E7009E